MNYLYFGTNMQNNGDKRHKHYALIMKWIEDPSQKVWVLDHLGDKDVWRLASNPQWLETVEYYVGNTPPININNTCLNSPLKHVQKGQLVYVVNLWLNTLYTAKYFDPQKDNDLLAKGLCHSTANNAIAHAKALLSFTT
jgi:hypothetical protein